MASPSSHQISPSTRWIWRDGGGDPAPRNAFTWFRRVIHLDQLPSNPTLRFAANSNARLVINGHVLRRKVARYDERFPTAEVVEPGPWLRPGPNVLLVLHHNWGDITTFQRTGNGQATLWIDASWVWSDESWKWSVPPHLLAQDEQTTGIAENAHRIRYAIHQDAALMDGSGPAETDFDDSGWATAMALPGLSPTPVETPGQREYFFPVRHIVAAGTCESGAVGKTSPREISGALCGGTYRPDGALTREATKFLRNGATTIRGKKGESIYLTMDFQQPLHGYPLVDVTSSSGGTVVDLVYAEIARSQYSGRKQVGEDGWLNPELVVGPGYTDRIHLAEGSNCLEVPDERTARWMGMHLHFVADGEVTINRIGMIKSQYPIKALGSFECGDPLVDRAVRLMEIHAEVTMTDAYVDTPGREDGQWIEDARLRAVVASTWFGDTHLRRFLLRTHIESQDETGNTHPFAPSNYPVGAATYDWSIQWVGALHDEYQWSGDRELIRLYWDPLCHYWSHVLSHVNEDGLWCTGHVLADLRTGTRPSKAHQSSGLVTPMVIEELSHSVAMARVIGEEDQAAAWSAMVERLVAAFRAHHIVAASDDAPAHVGSILDPRDPAMARGISQAGQTIAVYTGLLDSEHAAGAVDFAFPAPDGSPPPGITRWNNPTWSYRALRALVHVGQWERAVAHLLERCSQYLPAHPSNPIPPALQGPAGGPLPEYWISREDLALEGEAINDHQPEDETGSHGWAAVPLAWLHEFLLGVTIQEPGGGVVRICPNHGGMPHVTGWVNTPKGPIHVHLDSGALLLEIILTGSMRAVVQPPTIFLGRRVRKDGVALWDAASGEMSCVVQGPGTFRFECW